MGEKETGGGEEGGEGGEGGEGEDREEGEEEEKSFYILLHNLSPRNKETEKGHRDSPWWVHFH